MKEINQHVPVTFNYKVLFTENLLGLENPVLAEIIKSGTSPVARRVFFAVDSGVAEHHPELIKQIDKYSDRYSDIFEQAGAPVVIPGGEAAKNNTAHVEMLHRKIHDAGLDRHCYVVVIGGGAVIDTVGYAAATAHRGIRLIRVPTTVLAQNDAGIGVKNGINAFGKKNFLGTFTPPFAVINDSSFLSTLHDRDWRAGIAEAIKVALIKDAAFFDFLEKKAVLLADRSKKEMDRLIYRCAELHLEHIATSGDPFETGSSRPLDFGHWAAHKLEQLTGFELRHGEAVAIGIALDATYSRLAGMIEGDEWERILQTFRACNLPLFVPELKHQLDDPANEDSIFHGLEEFREHLGGELTIMLLQGIGEGKEVHTVDYGLYRDAIEELESYQSQLA
ncbi:MAG: 3-dehydroquinate synthase [Balneolaceae bacterium]